MANKKVRSRTLVGINRNGMYKIFAERGFTKGCEVGVMAGKNALSILKSIPNLELILVDPYMVYEYRKFKRHNRWKWHLPEMNRMRRHALKLVSGYNVRWLMTTSVKAAPSVEDESLDFVYIDGNHSYDFITQDLQAWYPKVRSGGIVSGHDYGIRPVRQAVDVFAKHHGLIVKYTDPHADKSGRNLHRSKIVSSWMMEKP